MAADPSPHLPSCSPRPAERSPSAPSCDGAAWGAAGCRGSTAPTCCSPRSVSHHWTCQYLGFFCSTALVPQPGAAVLCRCAATAVRKRAEGEEEEKRGGHRGAWCSAPPFWCISSGSTGSAVVHRAFTAMLLPQHHQHHLRRCAGGSPGGSAGRSSSIPGPRPPQTSTPRLHCLGCRWAGSDAARSCFPTSSVGRGDSTSAEHQKATGRASDGCVACGTGGFLREGAERSGKEDKEQSLGRVWCRPPPAHSTQRVPFGAGTTALASSRAPPGWRCLRRAGACSSDSRSLTRGQLFISSLSASTGGVQYAAFSYPEIDDRSCLP